MSDHHPDWETGYAFALTVTEAATVLRISRSTAYALVASGVVPSVKLGRRIVVPIRPLAEMLGLTLYDMQIDLGKVRRPRVDRTVAGAVDRLPSPVVTGAAYRWSSPARPHHTSPPER